MHSFIHLILSMTATTLETKTLTLVPNTPQDLRALIDKMNPSQKAQISPDWLARLHSTAPDPWMLGFSVVHRASGRAIGQAGFKGPPAPDNAVEIAYGIDPDQQGKGYATEAAETLTAYAFSTGQVRIVRAHTLPQPNASTRVLTKCGFRHIGEVNDPEDGLVWRWEKYNLPL